MSMMTGVSARSVRVGPRMCAKAREVLRGVEVRNEIDEVEVVGGKVSKVARSDAGLLKYFESDADRVKEKT